MKFNIVDTGNLGYGKDIIFVNGYYYICSIKPSGISKSNDLKNWEFTPVGNNNDDFDSIAYGNSKWVVASNSNFGIYVSTDGNEWINHELRVFSKYANRYINASFNTVRFVNNHFLIVSGTIWTYNHPDGSTTYRDEGHIFSSQDGINFEDVFESDSESFMEIAYGNGIYVAVGTNGGIYTSSDLKNWAKQNSNVSLKLVGVSYGKGLFVITGSDGIILTSKDGIVWTKQESGTKSYLIRSRYGNGMYIAVGYNATILTSIDGINWQEQDEGYTGGSWYGMVYANNRYVLTGNRLYDTGNIPVCYFDVTRDIKISDDDCLYIFNTNLEFVGTIDTFFSLRWRRKFFEAGEFDLVFYLTDKNRKFVKKDYIITRSNYTEAGIIEVIQIEDDVKNVKVTLSGRFLLSILERRIIKNTINYNGNYIDGMKTLLNNMASFPTFEIEPTMIPSDNVIFQCSYKNVYTYISKLSKASNIGCRIVPNIENKVFIFENYVGINRTINQSENERYCFSDDNYNLEKSTYNFSSKKEYNFALVGGVGEGEDRVLVTTKKGEKSGFDLREIFVDAKNQNNKDMSTSDYQNLLIQVGNEKLTDALVNFETTEITNDYKKKWDLGDIVNVRYNLWNIEEEKMIIEVEEVLERNKRTVYPTFGDAIPEVFNNDD